MVLHLSAHDPIAVLLVPVVVITAARVPTAVLSAAVLQKRA